LKTFDIYRTVRQLDWTQNRFKPVELSANQLTLNRECLIRLAMAFSLITFYAFHAILN